MSQASNGFRVFLSYNSGDRDIVEKIAAGLQAPDLDVFFDQRSLHAGHSWTEELEKALASCNGAVVFLGKQGLEAWQKQEVYFALDRKAHEGIPVVPVLLPEAKDPPLGFLTLNTWIDWRQGSAGESLESLIEKLDIALRWPAPAQRTTRRPAHHLEAPPYRGLSPFREEDASFYFGREVFVLSLRKAVEKNRLTGLVGPSGSGKSSVVHAGLLPDLQKSKDRGFWQAVPIRPGPHPIHSLASGLVRLLEPGQSQKEQKSTTDRLSASLLSRESSLESLSLKALEKVGASRLLLVVDQWEELYALTGDHEVERDRFIDEVLAATRSSSISALIIFRSHFFGRVMEHPGLRRQLEGDSLIHIPDMSPDDLRRAVVEPASTVGLSFEKGLVDEILNDLGQQPGQLPLLEFVLSRLWDERDKEEGQFLRDSYTAMEGLKGALTRKADEITLQSSEAEVHRLFFRLVRVEKDAPVTRRRARFDDLDHQAQKVALQFIENRLLVTGWDARTGDETLEIAHEALIHHWRRLSTWLDEEGRAFLIWRDQLEYDLETWLRNGEKESFLLTGGPLQVAELWLERHGGVLSPEAYAYVRLGLDRRRREQERRKLFQVIAAGLVVASLGLLGVVIYLGVQATHARSVALAAAAMRLADRKLDLALLLALQASRIRVTAEARGALLSLTSGNPALRHFLRRPTSRKEAQPEEILATAFGLNNVIATGGIGKVFLWDAEKGTYRGLPLDTGDPAQIVSLAFSSDGALLASGNLAAENDKAGSIHLWDLRDPDMPRPLQIIDTDGSTQNLTFGDRLLAWSTPRGIYIWDTSRRALVREIPRRPLRDDNWVSALAFGPSNVLASAIADGRIDLWKPGAGKPLWSQQNAGLVLGFAFPSEGGTLVSAGSSLHRWDLKNGKSIGESCNLLAGPRDEIMSVAFSRDGHFVASGHLDRKIRLWDISDGGCRLSATLSGHSGLIWTLAFGAERQSKRLALVSGGQGGDIILWEADPDKPTFSTPLAGDPPEGDATLAVSTDGRFVAVGDSQGEIALYDGKSQEQLGRGRSNRQRSVTRMSFCQEGRFLATGGPEGTVLLWDVQQRPLQVRQVLASQDQNGGDSIRSLATSHESFRIAAGTSTGRLIVWRPDVKNTPIWLERQAHEGPILSMAFVQERGFLKQKEYLVTGGLDGRLILWDPEDGKRIQTISDAHSQSMTSLAAGADGLLVSGSQDRSVRLWRIDHGLRPEETLFLDLMISNLALSPDGDLLAATGGEGSENGIALWDLKARIPLGNVFQTPGRIGSLAFDSSGKSLYMAGQGTSAWWDLRPWTWSFRACDMVRRDFYPLELERYLQPSEQPVSCAQLMQETK